jgi:hypothetical protein
VWRFRPGRHGADEWVDGEPADPEIYRIPELYFLMVKVGA